MRIIKATVQTNCTQDEYWRVSLLSEGFWDKPSGPIPSLNNLYLTQGDTVLVLLEDMSNPIILGKLFDYKQKQSNPVSGEPVLFQAVNGENWVVGTLVEGHLKITTSGGSEILIENEAFSLKPKSSHSVETETITVKGTTITVEGTNIEVKGSVKHNGKATPNGTGAWCGIPSCLFSGAPHTGNQTQE